MRTDNELDLRDEGSNGSDAKLDPCHQILDLIPKYKQFDENRYHLMCVTTPQLLCIILLINV